MSPVSVTARESIRVAEHLRFSFDRQKGSHAVTVTSTVPVPAGELAWISVSDTTVTLVAAFGPK